MKHQLLYNLLKNDGLDSKDIQIFLYCNENKYSITQIRNELEIAYKNLLPHLNKLETLNILKRVDFGIGKKKEVHVIKDIFKEYRNE